MNKSQSRAVQMCLGWNAGCWLAFILAPGVITKMLAAINVVVAVVGVYALMNMGDRLRAAWVGGAGSLGSAAFRMRCATPTERRRLDSVANRRTKTQVGSDGVVPARDWQGRSINTGW